MFSYNLLLGLPHTNYRQLAEYLLMMHLGHFQWQAIAKSVDRPLSHLRTKGGGEVYATFYYIETHLPISSPLNSFRLDDTLRVLLRLQSFKNIAVDGRLIFNHKDVIEQEMIPDDDALLTIYSNGRHPSVRFANVFVTPEHGNDMLKIAPPANVSFDRIPSLTNQDNAYNITRKAQQVESLGVFEDGWRETEIQNAGPLTYRINPDRDSNGAGLVYFANYFAFLDMAEQQCLDKNKWEYWPHDVMGTRMLRSRKLAYYGNVDFNECIEISVTVFHHESDHALIGFKYVIRRKHDKALICLSEAIKAITPAPLSPHKA